MESERLEPLETLEKDYYLGERNGWYSDGEQRDSESSDDELREQLRELAGMRCKSRKEKQHEKMQKKDKFELDMDNELSGNFVAHASKIFSSSSKENSGNLEIDDENEMDAESSGSKTVKDETIANSDVASSTNRDSSNKPAKSVTFEKQPDKHMNVEQSSRSSFDDDNNLLRKASNKVANAAKNETVEFYDSDEDEDNERWVRHHREQMKIIKSLNSSSEEDGKTKQKKDEDHETDAVLSCPACMSLLTRDCQRHELYHNQYRAVFVENCSVVENEVLFLPQSGKNKQKARKNAAGIKPNAVVDPANVTTLPKEDLFHPVLCSICATNVGVYDYEEVFHFFNVLTGYA
ncbi:E2F-associated phosphoprotein [Dirofilaria immitis]